MPPMPAAQPESLADDLAAVAELIASSKALRHAIGNAVELATTLFLARFESADDFRASPAGAREAFMTRLARAEAAFRANSVPAASIGFGLFRQWLAAVAEQDRQRLQQVELAIAPLRKRDQLPMPC